jgi:hypothetical protein
MNLRRMSVGTFVALAARLFLPRRTLRENPDAPAMANIRAIHSAEIEFFSRYGRYGGLSELGPAGADLLGGELAEGHLQGYTFLVRTSEFGYAIQSAPINRDRMHFRSYYSDQSLVIHESCGPALATALNDKLGSKQ